MNITTPYPQLNNACLVVAHPDDEVLWFSSIIAQVKRVVVCFLEQTDRPGLNRGRKSALSAYPLGTLETLGLTEAGVYQQAGWPHPIPSPFGLKLASRVQPTVIDRYQSNHASLVEGLRQRLTGFDTVFTHNPWGEYGHEEHVQVYRAVKAVQAELGFALWCSSYVGSHTVGFMARCVAARKFETFSLETQPEFAREIAMLYQSHGVWTWFDDYVWPAQESFLKIRTSPESNSAHGPLPLNYLDMGLPHVALADRSLRNLAHKARQFLPGSKQVTTPYV